MPNHPQPLRDAETFISEFERAEARGDSGFIAAQMGRLENTIAFLMGVNYRLAGIDPANTMVAKLQLRARQIRERHKGTP